MVGPNYEHDAFQSAQVFVMRKNGSVIYAAILSARVGESRVYGVFFGRNMPAYIVTDPNQKFFEDVRNRNIAMTVEEARNYQ